MLHQVRWTEKKIGQRIELIEPTVYRRRIPLPPWRYTEIPDPLVAPLVDNDVDDGSWTIIEANTYRGQ